MASISDRGHFLPSHGNGAWYFGSEEVTLFKRLFVVTYFYIETSFFSVGWEEPADPYTSTQHKLVDEKGIAMNIFQSCLWQTNSTLIKGREECFLFASLLSS